MRDIFGEVLGNDIDRNLAAQIDFFNQQWDKTTADVFRNIQWERDTLFGGFKNDLVDQYDAFEQSLNPLFREYVLAGNDIARQALPEIEAQWQQIRSVFWPEGTVTADANAYFKNLIDSVNNSINSGVSRTTNQAVASWASQSGVNAAVNQARVAWIDQLANIQGQKVNQQVALYNNLFRLQDGLRQEKFDFQDDYFRKPLLTLNEIQERLGNNLISWLNNLSSNEISDLLATRAFGRWETSAIDAYNRWELSLNNNVLRSLQQNQGISDINFANLLRSNQANIWSDLQRVQTGLLAPASTSTPVGANNITTRNQDGTYTGKDWALYQSTNGVQFYKLSGWSSAGNWISTNGLDFIKSFEWFEPNVYRDPVGIPTLWYGLTGDLIGGRSSITEEQASQELASVVQSRYLQPVLAQINVPLTQNQQDAIASFSYNLWPGKWWASDLVPLINRWDFEGASNLMRKYVYAWGKVLPGLVRRRNAEAQLMLS